MVCIYQDKEYLSRFSLLKIKNLFFFLTSQWVCYEMNETIGKNKSERTGLKVQIIVITRKQERAR